MLGAGTFYMVSRNERVDCMYTRAMALENTMCELHLLRLAIDGNGNFDKKGVRGTSWPHRIRTPQRHFTQFLVIVNGLEGRLLYA